MMEDKLFLICVTTMVVVAILSVTVYNVNESVLMSQNIEKAVAKGVDPLSVRCAYTGSQDSICVAYAATPKHIVVENKK
jgi:hypothetical protein